MIWAKALGFLAQSAGRLGLPTISASLTDQYGNSELTAPAAALLEVARELGPEHLKELGTDVQFTLQTTHGQFFQTSTGQQVNSLVPIYEVVNPAVWKAGIGTTLYYPEYLLHGTIEFRALPPGLVRYYPPGQPTGRNQRGGIQPIPWFREGFLQGVQRLLEHLPEALREHFRQKIRGRAAAITQERGIR